MWGPLRGRMKWLATANIVRRPAGCNASVVVLSKTAFWQSQPAIYVANYKKKVLTAETSNAVRKAAKERDTPRQALSQWKSNEYYINWVCVCSLRYPACNAHAPDCHLWLDRSTIFFPTYIKNVTIFGKTLLNIKCASWFSIQLLSETFFIVRINKRDTVQNVYRSASEVKCPLLLSRFNGTWILSTNFRKKNTQISNFMKIRSVGVELFNRGGRTDGHDEANGRFSQLCESA
jgi:hypothetical protein